MSDSKQDSQMDQETQQHIVLNTMKSALENVIEKEKEETKIQKLRIEIHNLIELSNYSTENDKIIKWMGLFISIPKLLPIMEKKPMIHSWITRNLKVQNFRLIAKF